MEHSTETKHPVTDILPADVPDEEFEPLADREKETEPMAVEARTYFQDAWSRFRRNRLAMLGVAFLALMVLMAILVPMLSPYAYDEMDFASINAMPSADHWLGTDKFGRDIFVRVMFGARISLTIGVAAALINLVIGVVYGGVCGYVGGKTDMILMRLVDIL